MKFFMLSALLLCSATFVTALEDNHTKLASLEQLRNEELDHLKQENLFVGDVERMTDDHFEYVPGEGVEKRPLFESVERSFEHPQRRRPHKERGLHKKPFTKRKLHKKRMTRRRPRRRPSPPRRRPSPPRRRPSPPRRRPSPPRRRPSPPRRRPSPPRRRPSPPRRRPSPPRRRPSPPRRRPPTSLLPPLELELKAFRRRGKVLYRYYSFDVEEGLIRHYVVCYADGKQPDGPQFDPPKSDEPVDRLSKSVQRKVKRCIIRKYGKRCFKVKLIKRGRCNRQVIKECSGDFEKFEVARPKTFGKKKVKPRKEQKRPRKNKPHKKKRNKLRPPERKKW